jgi:hypothetical protein
MYKNKLRVYPVKSGGAGIKRFNRVKRAKLKVRIRNLIVIASLIFGLVGLIGYARADTLSAGPLAISYVGTGPIFSEIAIAPGATFSKDINVTNNGTVSHSFALATKNVSGALSDKIYLEPIGGESWKMSIKALSEIPEVSKTVISSIAPGQSAAVTLKAEFDEAADNNYQDKNVSFDLVFGSQEAEPVSSPSVSPGSAAPTGGGTGGGGALLAQFTTAGTISTAASPTLSLLPSPAVSSSPEGEVKGEETSGQNAKGKPWWLLLLVPVAITASFLVPLASRTGVRTAVISGAVAAVLAYYFTGNIPPRTFWILLVAEIIIIGLANYLLVIRLKRLMAQAEAETAASKKGQKKQK